MPELQRIVKQLEDMREFYSEVRSDVADMCDNILEGKSICMDDVESRFIGWNHDGKKFLYDTLTTQVEVEQDNGEWIVVEDMEYKF